VVIAAATVVLGHSLETDRAAEQARQERFMRNAAFAVVDDLGAELFAMYSAFSFDLYAQKEAGQTLNRATLDAAVQRYRAQARFPELLQGVVTLVSVPGGGYRYDTWTTLGWADGNRPAWAADLEPPAPVDPDRPPAPRIPQAFALEKPVLTLYLRSRSARVGEVVAVALRFSPPVVLEQIVPALVRQRFTEAQESQPYQASVRNLSLASADQNRPSDWQVPLLPWTGFETWFDYYVARLKTLESNRAAFERTAQTTPEGSGTGWALAVLRSPNGLAAEMDGWRWRNAAFCLGFFLVLSLGLFGLYTAALRAGRLAQQERTFLALISHELKTPLAVVRSLSDNLANGLTSDPARVREYGQVLVEEADRLGRMVGNVLGLTAMQGGIASRDRVPVALDAVVRERLSREEDRSDVELRLQIHPGLVPVLGQPTPLSAAVDNLIGNAYRHGTAGPGPHRIRVTVEPRRRWGVRGVELTVEDNGPGFTRAEGRALRHPFRRGQSAQDRQSPGGGVGLSLVRATAEALGGSLRWAGRPGKGARFSLWLREAGS